jgi:hypothetical protein
MGKKGKGSRSTAKIGITKKRRTIVSYKYYHILLLYVYSCKLAIHRMKVWTTSTVKYLKRTTSVVDCSKFTEGDISLVKLAKRKNLSAGHEPPIMTMALTVSRDHSYQYLERKLC